MTSKSRLTFLSLTHKIPVRGLNMGSMTFSEFNEIVGACILCGIGLSFGILVGVAIFEYIKSLL